MARNAEVNVGIHVDDDQALRSFNDVGDGARSMARNIEKSSDDSASGFDRLSSGVDASEGKFRGFGDTIGGTSDIMQGFKDGNLAGVAMGFADLAGGLSTLVLPAFAAIKTFVTTSLLPTMTAVVTHPLFIAIAVGGAIILALILLEKKFGVVSGALEALGRVAGGVWDGIKTGVGAILGPIQTVIGAIKDAWNATIGGKGFSFGGVDLPGPIDIPGITLRIPTLHSGGVAPGGFGQESLRVLQGGERVIPAGGSGAAGMTVNVYGSLIHERDLPAVVAAAGRAAPLIGVT